VFVVPSAQAENVVENPLPEKLLLLALKAQVTPPPPPLRLEAF
jgi:hypothetical protein